MKRTTLFAMIAFVAAARAADRAPMLPEDFALRSEVSEAIDPAKFDSALMAMAIFHETNRVRRGFGLKPFVHLAKLDEAAELKVVMGVMQSELTHTNPLPATATPADRVGYVGLSYRLVAENLARLSLLNAPPGVAQVGVRRRNGREESYLLDTGRVLSPHTYPSFAARVVDDWMNSPPHRANIVNPALTSLGCAARATLSWKGRQQQIYAVQVFFTPR